MTVQRLARSALATTTTTTATTTMTTFSTVRAWCRAQAVRPLSTTALCRAPPRSSSHASSWPPQRAANTASSAGTSSKAASKAPSSTDPLQDLYPSSDPADWAALSSNAFQSRTSGDSSRQSRHGRNTSITLAPATGRTIYVGGQVDPARAFMFVNIMCSRNRVREDFMQQRFHVRPGLRRKQRKSLEKILNFNEGLVAATNRVKKLVEQGW